MAIHHLFRKQLVPISPEKAWKFFSDPYNLQKITPEDMGFVVRSYSGPKRLHPGQIIVYTVKPLLGIPLTWVTEITHALEPEFFVDEQRLGPYMFWHHKHYIRKVEGGVEMIDSIHYKVLYGWIGSVINRLMVEKKLKKIFDYRARKIKSLFGEFPA